jgi:2,4-dienoyl-CoA reductase-like NADH-dependent reductase (Old Yellow Enzyme family)
MSDLFDPCEFNGLRLQNRIALSPLTRTRSNDAGEAGRRSGPVTADRRS